ncbi:hypothetical protein ABVT39_008140 [Epinephelus coioides]
MSEEKPKEGVKTENDHINLKVAGQDGSVVQFKIKRHTPLSKLMKAYCDRQGLSLRQIRFRFDGQPINETDTPAQPATSDVTPSPVKSVQSSLNESTVHLENLWIVSRLLHADKEGGIAISVNHARRHYYRLGVEPKLCKIRITAKKGPCGSSQVSRELLFLPWKCLTRGCAAAATAAAASRTRRVTPLRPSHVLYVEQVTGISTCK